MFLIRRDRAQRLPRLLPGMWVEVKTWPEILPSLEKDGTLEGLPFMPEMVEFCGKRIRVSKRIERTCEEINGTMRRIRNTVFLEGIRCNGTQHGGCQKGCFIFWKEPWLRLSDGPGWNTHIGEPDTRFPFSFQPSEDRYVCQSTELLRATSAISALDIRTYIRDIRARTYSVSELLGILSYAVYLRIRSLLRGASYRVVKGAEIKTPKSESELKAGDLVQIRSKEEIVRTLDERGKNRGLAFTVEMIPFCGGTFRVLRRLERMIQEGSRKLIFVKGTVILENVTCDGCHILRGGCPRENFHFWRESWLRRVDEGVGSGDKAGPANQN